MADQRHPGQRRRRLATGQRPGRRRRGLRGVGRRPRGRDPRRAPSRRARTVAGSKLQRVSCSPTRTPARPRRTRLLVRGLRPVRSGEVPAARPADRQLGLWPRSVPGASAVGGHPGQPLPRRGPGHRPGRGRRSRAVHRRHRPERAGRRRRPRRGRDRPARAVPLRGRPGGRLAAPRVSPSRARALRAAVRARRRYGSARAAARALGLEPSTVRARLRMARALAPLRTTSCR